VLCTNIHANYFHDPQLGAFGHSAWPCEEKSLPSWHNITKVDIFSAENCLNKLFVGTIQVSINAANQIQLILIV
jgi:hypothetical protein